MKYCDLSICMSVGLSACIYQNYMSSLHVIFCMCYVCQWLGPSLLRMHYVAYFCFTDDIMFSHSGSNTDTLLANISRKSVEVNNALCIWWQSLLSSIALLCNTSGYVSLTATEYRIITL